MLFVIHNKWSIRLQLIFYLQPTSKKVLNSTLFVTRLLRNLNIDWLLICCSIDHTYWTTNRISYLVIHTRMPPYVIYRPRRQGRGLPRRVLLKTRSLQKQISPIKTIKPRCCCQSPPRTLPFWDARTARAPQYLMTTAQSEVRTYRLGWPFSEEQLILASTATPDLS